MSAVVSPCLAAAWLIGFAILAHIALMHNARNSMQLRDWRWLKWSSITAIGCIVIVLASAPSEDARSSVSVYFGISNVWVYIGMSLFLLVLYIGITRLAVRKIRALS